MAFLLRLPCTILEAAAIPAKLHLLRACEKGARFQNIVRELCRKVVRHISWSLFWKDNLQKRQVELRCDRVGRKPRSFGIGGVGQGERWMAVVASPLTIIRVGRLPSF